MRENKIVNEGGVPVIYFGGYKFKNKESRRVRILNIKDMSEAAGFKVEDVVVSKSREGNNKMLFGTVVPKQEMDKILAKVKKDVKKVKKTGTKIITPANVILGPDGKPLKGKK